MREVELCLHFLEPCLAGIRTRNRKPGEPDYIFQRNSAGDRALIMQDMWMRTLIFAAKASGADLRPVYTVSFDPVVDGTIDLYTWNHGSKDRHMVHEAFLAGSRITARAVIGHPLTPESLRKLLETGGRYAGLTVAGWRKVGKFEVMHVK